jgi:hypothetical protein
MHHALPGNHYSTAVARITHMANEKIEYQSLGVTFARQIDEARRASLRQPPLKDANALHRAATSVKTRSMARTIHVVDGEVVVLARDGRVSLLVHRTADKNGRMRVAGAVCVDGDMLRSNRPASWAHQLVKFAVNSMGGAA